MPNLIDQTILDVVAPDGIWQQPLSFRIISEPGEWSNAAFDLMKNEFNQDVLDPKQRLEGWLRETKAGRHEFPFLWTVAFIEHEKAEYLIATFDGNLMPVVDWARHDNLLHAPLMEDGSCILVIGRQATATPVREAGVGGTGRALFDFSVQEAHQLAKSRGRHIRYFVLESEERSQGFWSKMGFLWPHGTSYLQPPLEFDDSSGNPLKRAVEETLMFCLGEETGLQCGTITPTFVLDTITPTFVLDTIATVYSESERRCPAP